MPTSNVTKKAMADAMKELMETTPFPKISVGQICDQCGMNRKSFYYHFKDKQDLINWIYQSEFLSTVDEHYYNDSKSYDERWDLLSKVCEYFYENRSFYRKALKIEGQNSFSEYFRESSEPFMRLYVSDILKNDTESADFFVSFFADAFILAIKRWLLDSNCVEPEKFVGLLKSCIFSAAKNLVDKESME